eukprot:3525930-Pleurochrysis_carterae.AAC.2
MSALDAMMDICDCKERRLRRRVRYNCAGAHAHAWIFTSRCQGSKLLSARGFRAKRLKNDVCGAVEHQSHG